MGPPVKELLAESKVADPLSQSGRSPFCLLGTDLGVCPRIPERMIAARLYQWCLVTLRVRVLKPDLY
jgi:hypothetical protein